jgi:hypothetical protein
MVKIFLEKLISAAMILHTLRNTKFKLNQNRVQYRNPLNKVKIFGVDKSRGFTDELSNKSISFKETILEFANIGMSKIIL